MMRGGASDGLPAYVGSKASVSILFASSCDSGGRPMLLSSKSGLAMMSAGRASGFELVEEQIVFNRRKSRHGTGENMAKLYKKYKFDGKDTGNNNSRACTIYISFILQGRRPISTMQLFHGA